MFRGRCMLFQLTQRERTALTLLAALLVLSLLGLLLL
jgi:hypothetical protein